MPPQAGLIFHVFLPAKPNIAFVTYAAELAQLPSYRIMGDALIAFTG
jgi:hypothetical protein